MIGTDTWLPCGSIGLGVKDVLEDVIEASNSCDECVVMRVSDLRVMRDFDTVGCVPSVCSRVLSVGYAYF